MDNNGTNDQSAVNTPVDQVREILFGAQLKDMEIRFKRQEELFVQEMSDVRDSFKKRLDSLENFMRSEVAGLLERLKRESEEREAALKSEQRERSEALAAEQRERAETLQQEQRERIEAVKNEERERIEAVKNEERARIEADKNEERERGEAVKNEERERQEAAARLAADLTAAAETFERKLGKMSNTLDAAERDLRSLLLDESGSLNEKIEKKYANALKALARTNAQIRTDMVYRAALTSLFAETVGGLSTPWNAEALGETAGTGAAEASPAEENEEDSRAELPQVAQMGSADNY